ncbi:hypothetical protein [Phycicoccus sonneratiae]|uniref:Uncharacterized protein n=1 Tax=Phycicoccus sonneratiae TaxID=2807628 RepID=A0ABS2CN54_9MICO|nr:hypothetical protein [Phycicoccus sonneraticus]MBM6401298.1 hypothetical protein [Phycicoccus sonneraticus]
MSHDPHLLDPRHLPTPFSADEIRAASPDGRTQVVRVEPAGAEASTRRIVYAEAGDAGAVQVRTPLGPDGAPAGESAREAVTWVDLQAHASFPADRTVRERVRLEHPLGDLDCLRYTVTDGDAVDHYWFDLSRPGMPVLVESRRGPDLVVAMTVLSDEVSGPPPA